MKKLYPFMFAFLVLSTFSCETEKLDGNERDNLNGIPLTGSMDGQECLVTDADLCKGEGPFFSFQGFGTYWSSPESNQLKFVKYQDGSVNIYGQISMLDNPRCESTVNIWLTNKRNYDEWVAIGGNTGFPDPFCSTTTYEDLEYYEIDENRSSFVVSNCNAGFEDWQGDYDVFNITSGEEREGFQIGIGAAFKNSGDAYGLSGFLKLIKQGSTKEWFSSFYFTLDCEQEEMECETAFAYGGDQEECFLNYDFNRWGWSIGPLSEGNYTYDIYAAAGQCDLSKGEKVGTVDVSYSEGDVSFTYNIDPGYVVEETHSYAGNAMFPTKKKGQPTVAPGQYTIQENLEGEIYVIAHAVVCN